MADHDHVPYIVIERHSGGASPFLWGLLLGAGAALLLAPRSGEETQAEIRDRARRLRDAAEDRVDSVRGTVNDRVSRTREQVRDRFDSVRDAVDSRAHQAREVVDSGRRMAGNAGTELRRRAEQLGDDLQERSSDSASSAPAPPAADLVVTDVEVEEAEGRPGLG